MKRTILITALASLILANTEIQNHLLSEDGWTVVEQVEGGYTISQNAIPGYSMDAIQVSVDVRSTPDLLLDVIHDIENYEKFLTSAKSIDFETVKKQDKIIIGYQHINVPYFSNRHYLYRFDLDVLQLNERMVTGWELIPIADEYTSFIELMNSAYDGPIYLEEGVGRFVIDPIDNSRVRLSYRLYMDIGGWIPGSLVEKSNKVGVLNLVRDLVIEAEKRSKI
ncbi:MAG: hypothetical protein K9M49_04550 [Candidatus Marinimicrobia bacterium]|nr:hypothetical protein [Candidatus Neomarinimicrobiota bacterium]MCF7904407.1 hypothetical protein [Candidatus Neomarinimicrobiota bacterium]